MNPATRPLAFSRRHSLSGTAALRILGAWSFALIALLGTVGCQSPAGPDVDPALVQIDVDLRLATYREPPIVVKGPSGTIIVEGTVTVGHTNHALHPKLQRLRSGRYRLTLEAKSAGIGLTIVTGYRYRALLHPWPSGAYHLEVVVRLPDGSRHRAFDGQVVVH